MRRWRVVLRVSAVLVSVLLGGIGQFVGAGWTLWAAGAVLAGEAGVEVWLAVTDERHRPDHDRARRSAPQLTEVLLPSYQIRPASSA